MVDMARRADDDVFHPRSHATTASATLIAMAPKDQSQIIQDLENSREDFKTAVDGLSESGAKIRPEPDRWSVLECMEHVVTVEERLQGRLETEPRADAPLPDRQKEADLALRVVDRTARAQAPEPAQPKGRFQTLLEALEAFHAARDRSIRLAAERGEQVYSVAWEHPRFGLLNGGELLVLIAGHARRHAAQIRETRRAVTQ